MFNAQTRAQSMFTDQAAEMLHNNLMLQVKCKQISSLQAYKQCTQFNASQANAQAQFNAGQVNAA